MFIINLFDEQHVKCSKSLLKSCALPKNICLYIARQIEFWAQYRIGWKMWTILIVLSQFCLILVLGISYQMLLSDSNIFTECEDLPYGALDINGLFNLDELQLGFKDNSEIIRISGNITTVWDIQPEDRIVVK